MKRILFLLHLPPPVHGASTVAKYIHDSTYINSQFDTDYISIGLNTKIGKPSLKEGIFKFIRLFASVNRRLFSRKYDLIYFTMTAKGKAFLKDAFFIIWLNLIGYKVVTHLHNKGVSESKNQVFKALYRWVFKKNHTIQLSERLFSDISEYAPTQKVYFCPNGVDDVGGELGVSNLKKYDFLFLSNLIESKGILIFMEACRLLANSGHSFKVAVVGSDGDVDQDYLKEFVVRNKLESFITILGPKFGEAKRQVFQESKVFVFPTFYHYECFPLVLLEAMSNAMPLISTNEGAILDILDHGVNGLLVDKKDAVSLSEAMHEFLIESEKGRTMGLNSRKKYEEEFTRETFERNITNILNKVVR